MFRSPDFVFPLSTALVSTSGPSSNPSRPQVNSNPLEALVMGLGLLVMEVSDAASLLRGKTQLEFLFEAQRWLRRRCCAHRQAAVSPQNGFTKTFMRSESPCSSEQGGAPPAAGEIDQQRRWMLVSAATHICVAEAVGIVLVASQLLILPMNPNKRNALPVAWTDTLCTLTICLIFELLGVCAWCAWGVWLGKSGFHLRGGGGGQ